MKFTLLFCKICKTCFMFFNNFETSSLSPSVKYFTDHFKAVLMWIFYVLTVVFAMPLCASVYMPYGHMLEMG